MAILHEDEPVEEFGAPRAKFPPPRLLLQACAC